MDDLFQSLGTPGQSKQSRNRPPDAADAVGGQVFGRVFLGEPGPGGQSPPFSLERMPEAGITSTNRLPEMRQLSVEGDEAEIDPEMGLNSALGGSLADLIGSESMAAPDGNAEVISSNGVDRGSGALIPAATSIALQPQSDGDSLELGRGGSSESIAHQAPQAMPGDGRNDIATRHSRFSVKPFEAAILQNQDGRAPPQGPADLDPVSRPGQTPAQVQATAAPQTATALKEIPVSSDPAVDAGQAISGPRTDVRALLPTLSDMTGPLHYNANGTLNACQSGTPPSGAGFGTPSVGAAFALTLLGSEGSPDAVTRLAQPSAGEPGMAPAFASPPAQGSKALSPHPEILEAAKDGSGPSLSSAFTARPQGEVIDSPAPARAEGTPVASAAQLAPNDPIGALAEATQHADNNRLPVPMAIKAPVRTGSWILPAASGALPIPTTAFLPVASIGPPTLVGEIPAIPPLDAEIGLSLSQSFATSTAPTSAAPVGQSPPPMAQAAAQQIAAALADPARDRGAPLELALDPPELGRVRLQIGELAGILTLTIHAERPETADLMRRHLDLLAQEFTESGLDAPSVRISQDDAGSDGDARGREGQTTSSDPLQADAEVPTLSPSAAADGALDLRL